MKQARIISSSREQTLALAQHFAPALRGGEIIFLRGPIGAGKTVFVKGFAASLGIEDNITSPTFTIIKEYDGDMSLYHMDVYRLNGKLDDLGIEEYFNKNGVTIIEWADMIEDYLPENRLDIKIKSSSEDENKRIISITPHGKKYEELCEAIL